MTASPAQNIYPVLFKHSLEPSLLADSLTGEILEANHAAIRFLRRPPSQLIGQPLTILLPPGQENALDGFLESIRIDGRTQNAVEAFKEHHHELVLLDLNMPRMGGEAAYVQIESICREMF